MIAGITIRGNFEFEERHQKKKLFTYCLAICNRWRKVSKLLFWLLFLGDIEGLFVLLALVEELVSLLIEEDTLSIKIYIKWPMTLQ